MSARRGTESWLRREDFALEHVPPTARRPSAPALFSVILAIPSALVFFAVGGALGQAYGTGALLSGLLVASLIIGAAGWILTTYACRTGLDSDLMSIRAGFGLKGSGITSAIYSVNFIVLFAIEASIIARAVKHEAPSVPRVVVLAGLASVVLLLAWWGVSSLARVMTATLPLFVVFIALAVIHASSARPPESSFWSYSPPGATVDATAWLSVVAALLAFIVNATVAADVGRFLKPRRSLAGGLLFGGVLQVASFGGATLLGAWFAWRLRGESNPGAYLPGLIGVWGVLCVLLSQVRINLINAYSGSLSLSNFAARLLGTRPGRHIWMIVLVAVATTMAMGHLSEHLVEVLTFEAVFVMAWVATLVSYILLVERRGFASHRALGDYPSINPVGVVALVASLVVAVPLAFGVGDGLGKAIAPLAALAVAPTCVALGSVARRSGRRHRYHPPTPS